MKKLFCLLLMTPLLLTSQEYQEPVVFQNVMLTVAPGHTKAFETALAAHNKKFHPEGPYQVNVYTVNSGKNAGKYMWNMGPLPWSAMDGRPGAGDHDDDWDTNVVPHLTNDVDVNYWKFHPQFSNFSKDFNLKNLSVFMIDIKRFKEMDFFNKVLANVNKVYAEKMGDQIHGAYTNELNNMEGLDFAWVDFFDNMSWMGREDKFPQDYEAVHGEGSFAGFLKDVADTTEGQRTELWSFRADLSGTSGEVKAVDRQ